MNYLDYGKNKGKLNKLQSFLQLKRNGDYFKGLGAKGVIGVTNLKEQRSLISNKHQINLESGTSTLITENLLSH